MLLNICLGIIMFGIALGIKPSDFKQVALNPKGVATGFFSQFVLLPALTCILILATKPHPALALGMILVAACPGGNISNFIASISGGNTALSVALTGIATLATPILTPPQLRVMGKYYPLHSRVYAKFFFGLHGHLANGATHPCYALVNRTLVPIEV